MYNSSFYHDGFNDGISGRKAMPPSVTNSSILIIGTAVYYQEYMIGWNEGRAELLEHVATMPFDSMIPSGINEAFND
jgi:hypothetical protein